MTAFRRPRRICQEHLAHIRTLPCCVCGRRSPSEAHHLKQTGERERGMGRRSSDRWAVPLCPDCHRLGPDAVEDAGSKNEVIWFAQHGVNGKALAETLWEASPHREAEHNEPPQQERGTHGKRKKRVWPKGRRLQSRGFDQRWRRRMDGIVERRNNDANS